MSSHHIVRDEQEPALLILRDNIDSELLGNLLEWSPTVIIDAKLAKTLLQHSFKIDVVIGTENEIIEAKKLLTHQEPVKYLSKNDRDETMLQAFYFLSAANYKAVNVIAGFDHESEIDLGMFLSKLTIVFYDIQLKWYYNSETIYKKWLPEGQKLILGKNPEPKAVNNLHKSDDYWIASSNGIVQLEMDEKGFWLGEAI